jgi:hypothetical protein
MIAKTLLSAAMALLILFSLHAQGPDTLLNVREAARIENVLASDGMQGRRVFTPGIGRAADFIESEFSSIGLSPMGGQGTLRQAFTMIGVRNPHFTLRVDGSEVEPANLVVITPSDSIHATENSGYEIVQLKAGDNFSLVQALVRNGKNKLVVVDTSFSKRFPRLAGLRRALQSTDRTVAFLLDTRIPRQFQLEGHQDTLIQQLCNIVGVLPGKSRKNEYVVFSGHYDHLGIGKPVNGDSIFNGANDDAAGTTAVIMLARYFKALGNNERTLIFAAFTAEEVGGFGSQYFSRQLDPGQVAAMFNIEMIGTESKWGKNSAYITGYEKTDMGAILAKNLGGSPFTFYPDPYPQEQLFYRSDNATLARQGVPAHTISTSKMDNEPNYHKVSDEVGTLDLDNMARVVRAIALSARTIISGQDSPSRVNTADLK